MYSSSIIESIYKECIPVLYNPSLAQNECLSENTISDIGFRSDELKDCYNFIIRIIKNKKLYNEKLINIKQKKYNFISNVGNDALKNLSSHFENILNN